MESVTWVQILEEAICISHHANSRQKGMNPTIASNPVIGRVNWIL